ncbi:MAG: AAA family ATPase [Limnochordia bacterium]|nr:AAA family ATPase [Limnochordia bacterium]
MHISKVIIKNFKCFFEPFVLELSNGMNIIVGENEAGKSTILEAVNLALSGWIYGKYFPYELSQSLFNNEAVRAYLASVQTKEPLGPPEILIELFFEIEDKSLQAKFEGNGNSLREKASGVQFRVAFNEKHREHYNLMLATDPISSLPIEYYDFFWSTFARDTTITPRHLPFKAAFVDSSNTRLRNGSDVYISRIIRNYLSEEHKIEISQAHRRLRENFVACRSIREVNEQLAQEQISDKNIELSVDMSTKDAWESSITTYLDEVPFSNIGKGEQCLIKTKLALSHKKALEASILLLEEPENHLSHGKLNELLKYIDDNRHGRQVVVSTHSSFVANKLGLESLILLNANRESRERHGTRLANLKKDTSRFFSKLAGYDTLRLVLCGTPILVEGPSDELITQKAYMRNHQGRLPIQDDIDVILFFPKLYDRAFI